MNAMERLNSDLERCTYYVYNNEEGRVTIDVRVVHVS
jgi:hypothetical protein